MACASIAVLICRCNPIWLNPSGGPWITTNTLDGYWVGTEAMASIGTVDMSICVINGTFSNQNAKNHTCYSNTIQFQGNNQIIVKGAPNGGEPIVLWNGTVSDDTMTLTSTDNRNMVTLKRQPGLCPSTGLWSECEN